MLLDLVKQRQSMILGLTGSFEFLKNVRLPLPDNFLVVGLGDHVETSQQTGSGDGMVLVVDAVLDVPFYLLQVLGVGMLGNDGGHSDAVHPEQVVFAVDVFADATCQNVDRLFIPHLLYTQVDHPSQFLVS